MVGLTTGLISERKIYKIEKNSLGEAFLFCRGSSGEAWERVHVIIDGKESINESDFYPVMQAGAHSQENQNAAYEIHVERKSDYLQAYMLIGVSFLLLALIAVFG